MVLPGYDKQRPSAFSLLKGVASIRARRFGAKLLISAFCLYIVLVLCHPTTIRDVINGTCLPMPKASSPDYFKGQNCLVLHVGPPKTGTTSLQTDLTNFAVLLRSEGYEYAGRFYEPFVNYEGKVISNRHDSKLLEEAKSMFKVCHDVPPQKCAKRFKDELDNYSGTNVIISDESFSQWRDDDIAALGKVFAEDQNWNVTVVITYRHLFEWLPSTKFQRERIDRWSAFKSEWPGPSNKGQPLEPLFPTYIQKWRDYHRYCDRVRDSFQNVFSTVMLSMYNDASLRTTFLCSSVLNAAKSCEISREQDKVQNVTFMNLREDAPSCFYDAVATAAAARGWVNTSIVERRTVACDVKRYQEQVIRKTFLDFPLACPTTGELEEFLKESLALEATLLSNDGGSMEHKKSFRMRAAGKDFCWVDTDSLLANENWKAFFVRFKNDTYAKNLKYGWTC